MDRTAKRQWEHVSPRFVCLTYHYTFRRMFDRSLGITGIVPFPEAVDPRNNDNALDTPRDGDDTSDRIAFHWSCCNKKMNVLMLTFKSIQMACLRSDRRKRLKEIFID